MNVPAGMKFMTAFALCAALGAQARQQGPGCAPGLPPAPGAAPGAMMPPMPWLRMLDLSEAQAGQVQAVRQRHEAAREAKLAAARGRMDALRDALEEPGTGEDRIRTLHAAESEARLQVLLEERAVLREIDAVLTPDQRAKAQRLRGLMRQEREARRALQEEAGGPMGGPGLPPPPMPGCGMPPSPGGPR